MSAPTGPSDEDLARELADEKSARQRALAEVEYQRRLKDALEEAVRARDAVLSVVAHDLRNPLNVISLAASALSQRLPEAADRRLLERITRSAQRADRMIADLLAISAIETGRFAIETDSVETTELILAALESQHSLAAAASVILAADLSPALPALEADEDRLLDVLENLIGNAIKFTSAGGSITVGASRQASDVLIWVKDSGSGIAPEQLPHIFDRFWQARKKERRGIGLGLSICKAIVEAHGGTIEVASESGTGSTFTVRLPLFMRL